jgi:hypothetical protein
MPMPQLTRKLDDQVLQPTENAKKLFQAIYLEQNEPEDKDDTPRIKVSSIISKMSFYYEKIRNSVDYKEEHLLRKNAILRILKRQILIQGAIYEFKSVEISKQLLVELIRAGYLPNNSLPETKFEEIGMVIDKYIKLRKYALIKLKNDNKSRSGKELKSYQDLKNDLNQWIISLAACDIEERLGRSVITQMVISNMFEILNELVKLPVNSPYVKDKEIQLYISIHRSLLKFDRDMVSFIVFKFYNGNWIEAGENEIKIIGTNILTLRQAIIDQIDHPLEAKINIIVSKYALFYSILTGVISEDPVSVYDGFKNDPKAFPRQIKKECTDRYKKVKKKLWRAGIRSIIYIFLTKSVFAVILEVPASTFLGEVINPVSLVINIMFPAALLFVVILFTKMPGDANTSKIVEGINELIFIDKQRKEPINLREPVKSKGLMNTIFGIIYAFMFFLSLYLIVRALTSINFNWVSIVIFLFFLAFVSFFSFRIRKSVKEMIIVEPKENFFTLIMDFFYTPIVGVGKWMSEKFSRINVFVFILDFIIEAPFKIFVEVAEEWTKYVKERKDEIV